MSAKPVFLVVDDSRLHHQMYMLVFAKGALAGSTLLHAKNGREGYALFTTHPEIEMVFLDLNMPEMNGLELAEALHSAPETMRTRVVVASGAVGVEERARFEKIGVVNIFEKPIRPQAFLEVMQSAIAA